LKTSLALQIVTLSMPIYIFFCGETFISLWIGPEYALLGRWVMYFLLVGLVFDSISTNAFRILMAQAVHGKCAITWLVLSVFSIPLGVLGASMWGINGVVLGTTIVTIIGNVVTLLMACSAMKVSLKTYFSETLVRLIYPLLLLSISLGLMVKNFPVENYWNLIVQIIISGIIYCISLWLFTLNTNNRARIVDYIRNKRFLL